MYLNFTDVQKELVIAEWGPLSEIPDGKAGEIVESLLGIKVEYASFSDEESIYYREREEEDYEKHVPAGWNEDYLRTLGMSLKDFC